MVNFQLIFDVIILSYGVAWTIDTTMRYPNDSVRNFIPVCYLIGGFTSTVSHNVYGDSLFVTIFNLIMAIANGILLIYYFKKYPSEEKEKKKDE